MVWEQERRALMINRAKGVLCVWISRVVVDASALGSIRDDRAQLGSLNSVGGAVEESRDWGNYDTVRGGF